MTRLLPLSLIFANAVGAQAATMAPLHDGEQRSVDAVVSEPNSQNRCWGLNTKFGRLETTYLRPEFSIDGLRVIVTFSARHDLATTCTDSPAIVTILSISRAPTDEEKAVAAAALRDEARRRHIFSGQSRRADTIKLRQDNITDEEVREVQQAAHEIIPDSVVNISGVTDGCDCEEGASCTAQVWVVMYRPGTTRGLLLSKIGGHWAIGAVQRWWLRYARYLDRRPSSFGKELWAWNLEGQQLMTTFPQCESSGPTKKEGAH